MKNLYFLLFLLIGMSVNAQVAINTDGTLPDNSAMLDIKSTTQGILLPRLTQVQRNAIVSPANGLMIYQTGAGSVPGFFYNSGTPASPVWVMTGTGAGWGLNGNSGTSNGVDFIGTTDDIPLTFKVNNQPAGKIDQLLSNTSLGYQTLAINTTGGSNTAFGYQALFSNTTGGLNTANGYWALHFNTEGSTNTAIGPLALRSNTTGSYNTANGSHALFSNTTGTGNTANGTNALSSNTSGEFNVASGMYAMYHNTIGNFNTANGYEALYYNTSGNENTAIGHQSLNVNTTGSYNTGNGSYALHSNTTGNNNAATGYYALFENTTGHDNTANGYRALTSNTTGNYNIANGGNALTNNTTGSDNTANGYRALSSNTTGINNTANGKNALYYNTTGDNNTANGFSTLVQNTTGYYNTANGTEALYYNISGHNNTACGNFALNHNTTGDHNAAIGTEALFANTIGFENTSIGYYTLYSNTTGDYNTAIGTNAGSFNDANSNCSFFGHDADQAVSTNFSNATAIGNSSRITASNQVRIGNSAVTSIGGYANWSNISDGRYKKDVNENVPGLAFIDKLKPITYHLDVSGIQNFLGEDIKGEKGNEEAHEKSPEQKALIVNDVKGKEQITYSGFIAQDVEKAANSLGYDFSGVDKPQNENSLYGLRYAEFVVPLVKAVQELNAINEAQNITIEELKALNLELIKRMEKLESRLP